VPEGRCPTGANIRCAGTERPVSLPTARDPLLEAVDLHGAHNFRHTFATWLEDAGIPARVIDEVMGHEATSRAGQQRGSAMGAHYRHHPGDGRPHRHGHRAAPHDGPGGR